MEDLNLPNEKLPNILLILADQHRYDCIGYSNTYPINTPNLDKLAKEGAWFTNAYTPLPVCCPSRQSMLNGRRPETFGALWNYTSGINVQALKQDEYTWVKDIRENGYRTAHIGKWNVNPEYGPTYYGFDDYVSDSEYNDFRKKQYPDIKFCNGYFGELDPIPLEDSHTHWLANKTIQMVERYNSKNANKNISFNNTNNNCYNKNNQPWLISLDFTEPHLPCRPSEPFASMYNPSEIPTWPTFVDNFQNKPYIQKQQLNSWNIENYTWDDWAPIVARYYGVISQMDDAIGKVINKLDSLGLEDNTIVIYTADHGDMCGSHGMIDKHYVLYDDIVKVPFMVKWPKKIESGTIQNKFVCHSLDIAPTIIDIVKLFCEQQAESTENNKNQDNENMGNRNNFQGKSLLPLLMGKKVDDWRSFVVSTYNGQQFGLYTQRMIRTDTWKYIWNATDIDELYNLEDDPNELCNLIYDTKYSSLLKKLRWLLYEELLKDKDSLIVGNEWIKNQLIGGKIL